MAARALIFAMTATFTVMRAWLWVAPDADFDVLGHNIHHLFTGVLVVTAAAVPLSVAALTKTGRRRATMALGVGLGLVLDEWVYLIATDGSNAAYSLPVSFWGGVIAIAVGCMYAFVWHGRQCVWTFRGRSTTLPKGR